MGTSLYIDKRGIEVRADGEALAFYEDGVRSGTVPIAPIDRVFIRGTCKIESQVFGKLGERGIGVIFLSGRHGNPAMFYPRPHNDASRRLAQYHLSLDQDFCFTFSKDLVREKIRSQQSFLLDLLQEDREHHQVFSRYMDQATALLESIDEAENRDSIRGIEGNGAKAYFAVLKSVLPASLNFTRRTRRPPKDPFNAVLSLSYTLLHFEAVTALYGAGLDPYIGFFHKTHFSRESLACDIIEPVRAEIDRFSLRLFRKGTLRPEGFSTNENGCLMGKAARTAYYPKYEVEAEEIRKRLHDRTDQLVSRMLECARTFADSEDDEEESYAE